MAVLKRVLSAIAGVFGVDPVELVSDDELIDAVGGRVDDGDTAKRTALEQLADQLDFDLEAEYEHGPLQAVETIDDDPRTVYLHILEPGADEGAYADRLDKMYREQYGRSPRGLHVPLTELEELQEVDPSYFTQQAAPWLKQADERAAVGGGA